MISLTSFPEVGGGASPPLKEIIRDLQKTVSASRLNTFHQCRLKFFFRYVAEIDKAPTAALFVGKAVHAVLQIWNLARWRREYRAPGFYREVFDQVWASARDEVKWKGDELAQRDTAWAMLETYFRDTSIPAAEMPQGVEVAVEADLNGLTTLVGIIDLVRPGGKIVDFKTSSTTPQPDRSAHQNELQLTCYGVLYREATGVMESGFELHHLVKLKTPKLVVVPVGPVTPPQASRLYRLIESYLKGLEQMDFVPSPGLGCLGCEYFRECRSWAGTEERRLAA